MMFGPVVSAVFVFVVGNICRLTTWTLQFGVFINLKLPGNLQT